MSTRFHRIIARLAIVAALAFAGSIGLSGTASAYKLKGTYDAGSIATSCVNAGGEFHNNGGQYGCSTKVGDVECSAKTKTCEGTCSNCPKIKGRPVSAVGGALSGSRAAATSAAGGAATRRITPVGNLHQPVVLQRAGGHAGGGGRH